MAVKRSPNYPQITLEAALGSSEGIYRADMRNKMSQKTVSAHLGYTSVNGRSLAKIGALKAYDLLEGRGDELRLTERAVHLIADPKGSPAWKKNVRDAAFSPSIFKELFDHYEGQKASPENLRSELIKRGYTLEAVEKVAKIYLANYEFATPGAVSYNDNGKVNKDEDTDTQLENKDISVGDFIQWEADGVLKLDKAREVRAVQEYEGVSWVFIKGSETGIPMNEAILEKKGSPAKSPLVPPKLLEETTETKLEGESEWLRGPLSRTASYRLLIKGEPGLKEIENLISVLQAQKAVLND